jgi:hypothetical protein
MIVVEVGRSIASCRLLMLLLELGRFDMVIALGNALFGAGGVPHPAGPPIE